jgi:fructose transport system ATP-binding protein
VVALDHCDFDLYHGEILAVIGDNGAGKSTLIKACPAPSLPIRARSGWRASEVQFHSPIDGRDAGIETVYQTLAMSPALSIADNMFMGRELRKPGFMRLRAAPARPARRWKSSPATSSPNSA